MNQTSPELSGDPLSDDGGISVNSHEIVTKCSGYQVDGWGQKFRDQDLRILIKQDVDRTL